MTGDASESSATQTAASSQQESGRIRVAAVLMYPILVVLLVLAQPQSPIRGSSLVVATQFYALGAFFYSLLAWFGAVLDAKSTGQQENSESDADEQHRWRIRTASAAAPQLVASTHSRRGLDSIAEESDIAEPPVAASSMQRQIAQSNSGLRRRSTKPASASVLDLVRQEEGTNGKLLARSRAGAQTASVNPFIRALDVRVAAVQRAGGVYSHMMS